MARDYPPLPNRYCAQLVAFNREVERLASAKRHRQTLHLARARHYSSPTDATKLVVAAGLGRAMSDVFISYASQDDAAARRAAEALRARGFSVWRDEELPLHRPFSEVIEERLQAAKAVVVVWSERAQHSHWVRAEADFARNAGKLVQVSIDGSLPPLPFNQIHSADLSHWRGAPDDPHWLKVAESVAALVGVAPGAAGPRRTSPLWAKPRAGAWIWAPAAAAVLATAAGALWLAFGRPHPEAALRTAVAVVPFQVESASPEARFFADGVTDTIRSALNSNHIRVISSSESGALAGAGSEAASARLGVRLNLDGSVAGEGKAFDVSVHVDDAVDHVTLWSGHFTGTAEQPDELKTAVAATTVAVLNCSSDAIGPHGLSDRQVLMRFLQACDLYERAFDEPQLRDQLLDDLRQVTVQAPGFAPGLVMRAEMLLHFAVAHSPEEAAAIRAEARADGDRAVAIDPGNAHALAFQADWLPRTDWQGREAILRRALKADPDSAWPNAGLGEVAAEVGRMQEAADLLRKANAANPLALDWSTESARMSAMAGRMQEAKDQAAEVAKAWPNNPGVTLIRLEIASMLSDWDRASALLDGGEVELPPPVIAAVRSWLQASKTPTPALRARARTELLGVVSEPGGLATALLCLARMGLVDDALSVAQSYQPNSDDLPAGTLFSAPAASMRRDPRFMQLAQRIGLARYWLATGKWPDFCAEPGLPYDCKAEAARLVGGHAGPG